MLINIVIEYVMEATLWYEMEYRTYPVLVQKVHRLKFIDFTKNKK